MVALVYAPFQAPDQSNLAMKSVRSDLAVIYPPAASPPRLIVFLSPANALPLYQAKIHQDSQPEFRLSPSHFHDNQNNIYLVMV